jgi:hypothetical protein
MKDANGEEVCFAIEETSAPPARSSLTVTPHRQEPAGADLTLFDALQAWSIQIRLCGQKDRYKPEHEPTDDWMAERPTTGQRALRLNKGKWVLVPPASRRTTTVSKPLVSVHEAVHASVGAVTLHHATQHVLAESLSMTFRTRPHLHCTLDHTVTPLHDIHFTRVALVKTCLLVAAEGRAAPSVKVEACEM